MKEGLATYTMLNETSAARGPPQIRSTTTLGWLVQIYNAAEALPNLINPFWMLPVLGVLGLKARDLIGYSFIQFLINTPLVLFLLWLLGGTLSYHPATQ